MPTAGRAGINKNSHTSRPIYLSISVSVIDSRLKPREIPTGATGAPISIRSPCKARQILRRLCQTFFHAQLAIVILAFIRGLNHFLKAYVCSIRLSSFGRCVYISVVAGALLFKSLIWSEVNVRRPRALKEKAGQESVESRPA